MHPVPSTAAVCVATYAANLPVPFNRQTPINGVEQLNDTFIYTNVTGDTSFALLSKALYVVFNQTAALSILSANLNSLTARHTGQTAQCLSGAAFIPGTQTAIISQLQAGQTYFQRTITFSGSYLATVTAANYTTNPPISNVTGAAAISSSLK